MRLTLEEKLTSTDLSYEFTESLIKRVVDHIHDDKFQMSVIHDIIKEENPDTAEEDLTRLIEWYVEDIAEDAVSKLKIFCEFDLFIDE